VWWDNAACIVTNQNSSISTVTSSQVSVFVLLIYVPRLGVYYFFVIDSVCLSVCLSDCHAPSNWFFFFVFRWNRANFWPSSLSIWHSTKRCSSTFWFRPPNAQNLLPKTSCDNATLPRRQPWSRSQRGSSAWENSAIHWTSGPILVVMATKFGIGAEI